LIPDAPMLLFYIWEKIQGASERLIWGELYHHPAWQEFFNVFHSFPLLALACWLAWRARCTAWAMFFASMFCHSVFDFPVHRKDGHQHFFPFSDYQLISPISYWDPAHFGLWISALEVSLMVMGSIYLLRHSESTAQTQWVRGLLTIYLLFFAMAVVWWA